MNNQIKKSVVVSIIFLFSIIVFSQINAALSEQVIGEDTINKIEEGKNNLADFSSTEDKENYLKDQWTSVLQENEKTKWIYSLSPLFKFLFGVEFSVSWSFITALLIWTVIFSFAYPIMRTAFEGKFFSIASCIIITSIFCQFAMPSIINQMSLVVKTIWSQAINIIALIILALLLNRFGKIIRKYINERNEKHKIDKLGEESKRNTTVRKEFENIKKGAEDMRRGADGAD